ncbi:MAG: retention module-containing protein [Halioglobus sp.]|nr:retention module-containing protein [Halioglobus sp.]
MVDEALATVTSAHGNVRLRSVKGHLRVLKTGDTLLEGEIVITPSGGRVELAFSDGSVLLVTDVPEMAITRDLIAETAAGHDESAVEDETVQAILSTLQAGKDLSCTLDPAATYCVEPDTNGDPQGERHSWEQAFKRVVNQMNGRFVAKQLG